MAKYETVKTLKLAKPTVKIADGITVRWDIEVLYTYTRPNNTTWSRAYSHTEEVEYLDKTPDKFTKEELINFMPPNMDVIFDAHYDAHNTEPTEEKLDSFSVNILKQRQ